MLTLGEVKTAIAFDQPKLRASVDRHVIRIDGSYLAFENGVVAAPGGPITAFDIKMEFSDRYPRREPKVFEVGGQIPRKAERHINSDGDCCATVWENWLVATQDQSFASYINGPLNEYFLGQFWFEKTGKWPFGERPHGTKGLEEAYADALGIPNKQKTYVIISGYFPRTGRKVTGCVRVEAESPCGIATWTTLWRCTKKCHRL